MLKDMPHIRLRHLEAKVKKWMAYSPIVGIMGHRQVGKTTILEKLAKHYYTLDTKKEAQEAMANPDKYIRERAASWVALDECQNIPELFPELKDWVRKQKQPGQFLLSGSIRFTSRGAIRESLTGRIVNLDLLPLTLSEIAEDTLSDFCKILLESDSVESLKSYTLKSRASIEKSHKGMDHYFSMGGLPGVCFLRSNDLKIQKIDEQLTTMLDRDVRLVKKVQLSYGDIRSVVEALARQQGEPTDYTRIRKESGVSMPSIKKLLYCLEAIYLIRKIPIEGSTRGNTFFFEDQGEFARLLDRSRSPTEKMLHFCFTQIRPQFEYAIEAGTQVFQYRTRGGALVPLAFKNKIGCLGVMVVPSLDQMRDCLGSAYSFLRSYSKSKVIIVHPDNQNLVFHDSRIIAAPIGAIV